MKTTMSQIDGHERRERIRQGRRERRLAVLDDDPTGSQSVHDVHVVTVPDETELRRALVQPGSVTFVLTNTRGLSEPEAVRLTGRIARDLFALDPAIDVVSRSDSTLRGHVLAEVRAIADARVAVTGSNYDGVVLAPAFFEAGRFTEADVHYATVAGEPVPVGETEFARDATFGYRSSNLREFLAEQSDGTLRPDDVLSISLDTIRTGGPDAVRDVLLTARDAQFVVVNATRYSDYEIVVLGMQAASESGRSFLSRSGPSFVRALAGIEPRPPLGVTDFDRLREHPGHGLVVVGSHVSQTSRQVEAARQRTGLHPIELDVASLLAGDTVYLLQRTEAVRQALESSDVIVYTSRTLVMGTDAGGSLDIARTVSDAVSAIVSAVVTGASAARPAWVIAKGGITSHDVAVHGLGIRSARVLGQLLPGQISVFDPVSAPEGMVGTPYVVFAGNVGDDETLADIVETLHSAQAAS